MKTVKKLLFLAALTAGTTAPAYAAQYAHYGRKAADSASLFAKISLISGASAWAYANLLESIPTSEDYFKNRHSLTCPPPLVEDFVREIAKREQVENPGKVKVYTNPDTGSTASAARPDTYSQYIFLNKSVANNLSWALSEQNDEAMQSNLCRHRATITHEAAHLKYNHQ